MLYGAEVFMYMKFGELLSWMKGRYVSAVASGALVWRILKCSS